ncbi:MAG: ferritin-like domain-containing protein [Vicinamibacterales bacterium]
MKTPTTLHDAFLTELRDTFDAEKQILKALPKMVKAASSAKLRAALEAHGKQTRKQVTRLENVFKSLKQPVKGKHCDGMAGILKEGASVMQENHDATTMDACIIAAAQRVEHYEMAAYGTLVAWSRMVGNATTSKLLQDTLLEEKAADLNLTALAEAGINQQAAVGS